MKGFTLIETLIYIALLGLLLSGAIESSYYLLQSSSIDERRVDAVQEGTFVLKKIEWALAQAQDTTHISQPTQGAYSSRLTIATSHERIDICLVGDVVEMRTGSNTILPCSDASFSTLTSSASAQTLQFYFDPSGVLEASTTLSGDVFSTETYVEK